MNPSTNDNLASIKRVQFSILSPDEMMRLAVCEINDTKIKNKDGKTSGTVYDERMGTLDKKHKCLTCNQSNIECPGHPGYIKLAEPIINRKYIKYILRILRSVCYNCNKCFITHNELYFIYTENNIGNKVPLIENTKFNRLKRLSKYCMGLSICPHCNYDIVHYELKDNKIRIVSNNSSILFNTHNLYTFLSNISNDDLVTMGFNEDLDQNDKYITSDSGHRHQFRPEWMIFTVLLVSPPAARPYLVRGSEKHDDDITDKYISIIKLNTKLLRDKNQNPNAKETKGRGKAKSLQEKERTDIIEQLEDHIATLIDNSDSKSKILTNNRPHKSIVERTSGKDGRIRKNIQGKRVEFSARTVITGDSNICLHEIGVPEEMTNTLTTSIHVNDINIEYIRKLVNERKILYITRNGMTFDVAIATKNYTRPMNVRVGDIVDRKIQNGDWILFNRQPTLRVESMMAFQIRILKGKTFRLHLAATTPFNADFDGDEMNLHLPQNLTAIAELSEIMCVNNHIVSAQNSSPVITIVQDGRSGLCLMTQNDTMIPNYTFNDCVMMIDIDYSEFLKRAKKYYARYITTRKGHLTITTQVPGRLLFSTVLPFDLDITKKTDDTNTVIIEHGILKQGYICKKTISLIIHILFKEYSPSVASKFISDISLINNRWFHTRGFSVGIRDCITNNKEMINESLASVYLKCNAMLEENHDSVYREVKMNQILNSATNIGERLSVNGLSQDNRILVMLRSGAKGNYNNVTQIMAHVGSQNIQGKRIPKLYNYGRRTLPHYDFDDNTPEARGFVRNSYLEGLTAQEFFFHTAAGREGIIDTAIKTQESGYIQRKLVKMMENHVIQQDGTVRNCGGEIIQFMYGSDGFNAKMLYNVNGKLFFTNPYRISNRLNSHIKTREKERNLTEYQINTILKRLYYPFYTVRNDDSVRYAMNTVNTTLKNMLQNIKLKPTKFNEFNDIIYKDYFKSLAQAGDNVGLISSCSIGEITTQLTLNSVSFNTEIIIYNTQFKSTRLQIGQWIDSLLEHNIGIIKYMNGTEYLDITPYNIKIDTVNENGNIFVSPLVAVTRHPPHGNMIKITTRTGKQVTVTKCKSLLVWNGTKIVPINGNSVRIGHLIPCIDDGTSNLDTLRIGDVILDPVVYIEELPKSDYPTVYDVTVPETYNFCIANGMCVRDTFHSAGVADKDVTLGVPRLEELLGCTRNQKKSTMRVYLNSAPKDIHEALLYTKYLELVTLQKLIKNMQLCFIENTMHRHPINVLQTYEFDQCDIDNLVSLYCTFTGKTLYDNDWMIKIELDDTKMYMYNIKLIEIITVLNTRYNNTRFIPVNKFTIHVYTEIPILQQPLIDTLNSGYYIINESNIELFYMRNILMPNLQQCIISGIKGIDKVFAKQENNEWMLETNGSNLQEVLQLDFVDKRRTTSDNLYQIYNLFGIEAARKFLLEELRSVICFDNSSLDNRHIMILTDTMTHKGYLTAVRREGVDKEDVGPLSAAAFEKAIDNFIGASLFNESESVTDSVSAAITVGETAKIGTGLIDVVLDVNKFICSAN